MRCASFLVVLAACASEGGGDHGLPNPAMLWLAQGSGGTMKLVDAEPKPYWAPGIGAGRSYEAAFALVGDVPAGTYHLVLDCIVMSAVDVNFDLLVREGGDASVVSSWTKHFDPLASGYSAQAYETDRKVDAIDWTAGDELVLRYATSSTKTEAWIPNGDGTLSHGRIPNIALPK